MRGNPFFHRGPIKDQAYFFGRLQETRDILELVRNNQCISIVGPSHIGKTSLLFHLSDANVMAQHGLDHQVFAPVYIDCQGLGYDAKNTIYEFVLAEIGDALPEWQPEVMATARKGTVTGLKLNQVVKHISRSGIKLVLLLDEFEQIARNPHLSGGFFSSLRSLPTRYDVICIISSQIPLYKLSGYAWSALTSNFFNLFVQFDLGLFTFDEARELIISLSRRANAPFSERTLEFVVKAVGLHPFFLQAACRCAFERRRNREALDQADYSSLYHEISGELKGDFAYYWGRLGPDHQAVLADLETAQGDPDNEPHLASLAREGLIVRQGATYDYVAATFKDFVRDQRRVWPSFGLAGRRFAGGRLGPFRVVEKIGSGGAATVYKAYQPSLDRYVAVKILTDQRKQEGFLERFQREARSVAKLRHPNILTVHDFGQEQGLAYLVIDFVPGGTLAELIHAGLSLERAIEIAIQIGEALHCAHEQDIVHRDIKPANILIDTDGRPLLTDFGLVKLLDDSGQLTEHGTLMGTPAYVSPEQAAGGGVDARSDIYSLGIVLYEMVTGHLPFEAEDAMALVLKKLNEQPPSPRRFTPSLSEEMERVIMKAIARRADERHQSALEMTRALRSVQSVVARSAG